jgi:tetrapyrrole methylase family protein/MazG family protein
MAPASRLTIVGLGPGRPEQLTHEAWGLLSSAREVWARTGRHPTLESLVVPGVVHTFDHLYESLGTFDAVYERIAESLVAAADGGETVVYAVPGDPMIGEASVRRALALAEERGVECRIVHGLSFIEPALAAAGLDALAGVQIADALVPAVSPQRPALFAQVHDRRVASSLKLALLDVYPPEHKVRIIRNAGLTGEAVADATLAELDHADSFDHLTCVFVPALALEDDLRTFDGFRAIIARLRAPDGCPWDRKQTHQSLRKHLLEETYEVLAALDAGDSTALEEELGDILLQVFLQSQIAEDEGEFTASDVVAGIASKILRRHPHVFGDLRVDSAEEVVQNWQALKDAEKAERGEQSGVLDSVPAALPALSLSETLQSRAAGVGFDWPDATGVLDKVVEELGELATATPEERLHEFGDLLFSLVNFARHEGIDAEAALRLAAGRFRARFAEMERMAAERGVDVRRLDLAGMDRLWDEAKARLRAAEASRVP